MIKKRINVLGKNGSTEHSKGNKTVPEKVAATRTEDGHKQNTKTMSNLFFKIFLRKFIAAELFMKISVFAERNFHFVFDKETLSGPFPIQLNQLLNFMPYLRVNLGLYFVRI